MCVCSLTTATHTLLVAGVSQMTHSLASHNNNDILTTLFSMNTGCVTRIRIAPTVSNSRTKAIPSAILEDEITPVSFTFFQALKVVRGGEVGL